MKSNKELKKAIKKCGYYQYEIAELLEISESHFCKLLRKELAYELKQEIDEILAKGKKVEMGEVE